MPTSQYQHLRIWSGVQTQVCFMPHKGGLASALQQVFSSTEYQQLWTRFDPVGLNRHDIATDDLQCIERHIHILQSGLSETV